MAYIGKSPVIGNFVKLDAITAVNGQAAYTMQNGGSNFTDYESVNQFLVSLNGTIQAPTDSFTVSGSTLTFASNLSTGDVIDFIMVFGNSLSAGTPTDATVTAAKLNDDIISGQTALASEPADTDEFLVSDAGTLKRIDYSLIKGGGITEADMFRLTATITSNQDPISSNLERVDSTGAGYLGTGMTESSGIFTFPNTGIWLIQFFGRGNIKRADNIGCHIQRTTDNSSYDTVAFGDAAGDDSDLGTNGATVFFIFDVTNVSTHKVKFRVESMSDGSQLLGDTSETRTSMLFQRLGDT